MTGVVFSPNYVTLGGLLDGFRIGAGLQKDQAMIRSLECPGPTPTHFPREGSGVGNRVNGRHDDGMKPP